MRKPLLTVSRSEAHLLGKTQYVINLPTGVEMVPFAGPCTPGALGRSMVRDAWCPQSSRAGPLGCSQGVSLQAPVCHGDQPPAKETPAFARLPGPHP